MAPVLDEFLRAVDERSYVLTREVRHDLRARIWTHVAEQAGPAPDEGRVAAALAQLGAPEDLVADELARSGMTANRFRTRDLVPLHLLGASLPLLGLGAPIGLALLWRSAAWQRVHKVAATLLVVAGTPALLAVGGLRPGWALWLGATVVGAAAATVYLLVVRLLAGPRRSRRADGEHRRAAQA
jgi:hypothetical protein